MKKWNKFLGLGLSVALLTGALAGCSAPNGDKLKSTATPAPTAAPANETPLIETEDVVEKLTGIPGGTTMFTVDGEAVTGLAPKVIKAVGHYGPARLVKDLLQIICAV